MKRILLTIGIAAASLGISKAQYVTTWAGSGTAGSSANGTLKASANLENPTVLATDSKGNTYVGLYSTSATAGYIVAFDVNGKYYSRAGAASNGGFVDAAGGSSRLGAVAGIAIDKDATRGKDTVFFADYENNAIRKVIPYSTGTSRVITICGAPSGLANNVTGEDGYVEGDKSKALFTSPSGIAIDNSGTIIVADKGNNVVRRVTRGGVASLVAGYPQGVPGTKDGDAINASNQGTFATPVDVWVDPSNNDIYVLEALSYNIRKIAGGKITTYAKNYFDVATWGGGEPRAFTKIGSDWFITVGCMIIKVTVSGSTVTSKIVAGGFAGKDANTGPDSCGYKEGPGYKNALFNNPVGVIQGADATHLYIGDMLNNRVRGINLTGQYTDIDGSAITTGIESGFGFYPNPANDMLTIHNRLHKSGNAIVTFYDLTGRKVAEQNLLLDGNAGKINLSAMNGGAYIVRIQDGETTYTNRLIISK